MECGVGQLQLVKVSSVTTATTLVQFISRYKVDILISQLANTTLLMLLFCVLQVA